MVLGPPTWASGSWANAWATGSWSVAGATGTTVSILIAAVEVRTRVRKGSLTIRDLLNDAPNTCTFKIHGTAPSVGQAIRVLSNGILLFNGTLQTVDMSYEAGKAANMVWACSAIDDTARLNRRRPFGTWTLVSATTIAQYLITTFAAGFTSTNVQASLPAVTITFDGSEDFSACLSRLATMVGGYWYVADLDLHFFQTEATAAPDPIDVSHRFENEPAILVDTDLSQLRTRVFGKGHGEAVPIDILAGETIIPLDDAVMFNPLGGKAIAGTTPDGAQSEILSYTGTIVDAPGTVIGPGAAPSVAPALARSSGAGLSLGWYGYSYTDVTAAGETLPSPRGTIEIISTPAAPTVAPTFDSADTGGSLGIGYFGWAYSWVVSGVETGVSPRLSIHNLGTTDSFHIGISVGPAGTTARKVYRTSKQTVAGDELTQPLKLHTSLPVNNNTTTQVWDTFADSSLGANAPGIGSQVIVSSVALGGTGTTARKVYRTVAQASQAAALTAQLKLQQTVSNNTATTAATDATADGSLGANVPVSDTSGLTQGFGQVIAGSTSAVTTGIGTLASSGFLMAPTGDIIRYTGTSGNTITGIPATGPGSITTTLFYGDQLVPVPALKGVAGLTKDLQRGSTVHIWVQRDDVPAQTAQAALDGGTGIYEFLIIDERRGEASLVARCDADLAQFSRPLVTIRYATRDMKTKSGKTVVVNLTTPPISQTVTIQDVMISEIDVAANTNPKFMVTASSIRFSLEDLLRRLAA